MPVPDKEIASSFIEFYINFRKNNWKLSNDTENLNNHTEKTLHKLSTSQQVLKSIYDAKSIDHWLLLIDLLFSLQKAEEQIQHDRLFFVRLVTKDPLIADVLRAIRTYIISEIKTENEFITSKSTYNKDKVEIEKDILYDTKYHLNMELLPQKEEMVKQKLDKISARDEEDNFYEKFFQKYILNNDQSKELKEKTFEDFKKNVNLGHRKTNFCDWLLKINLTNQNGQNQNKEIIIDKPVETIAEKNEPPKTEEVKSKHPHKIFGYDSVHGRYPKRSRKKPQFLINEISETVFQNRIN